MQYFDKRWFSGELSEKEIVLRELNYEKHINSLKKNTNSLIRILIDLNFHDGIIIKENGDFLFLYIGDNQNGYYSVNIQFDNLKKQTNLCVPINIMGTEFFKDNSKYSFHILDNNMAEYVLEFADIVNLEIKKIDNIEYFKYLQID